MTHTRLRQRIAAITIAVLAILLTAAPASASPGIEDQDAGLPRVPELLDEADLEKIGSYQTEAEITAVIAAATPEQRVQVLIDSHTWEYKAAVFVEETPDFTAAVGAASDR